MGVTAIRKIMKMIHLLPFLALLPAIACSKPDTGSGTSDGTTDDNTPKVEIPGVPDGVKASSITENSIFFEWNAARNASTYSWSISKGPDEVYSGTTNHLYVSVKSLSAGTEYGFRVRAVNSAGASDWSGTLTVSTSDNFVVQGDLELIDEGKLRFVELYDQDEKVTTGEQVVTSNISEKYLEGLFIGYVSEIEQDTNNLTKTGTIVTPVDFRHLKNVFVITRNKQDVYEDRGTVNKQEISEEGDTGNDAAVSAAATGDETDISEDDTGNDGDVSEEDTGTDRDVSEEDTGIGQNVFEEGDDV